MYKCCDILIKKEGNKMAIKIIGDAIPNLPWQDRPAELGDEPVWRYDNNPIINRNPTKKLARVFNSAAVPFGDGFAAVFRGEQKDGIPHLYKGFSKDGINWEIEDERVELHLENGEICTPKYEYDPRIVKIEDTYYIIWCEDFHGAAIGMAKTKDFENFTKLENPFIPYNRKTDFMLCCPVPATAPTHHSATYSSATVPILNTGATTATLCLPAVTGGKT